MIKVLKYPHPYKAWLTISNDPDNTTIEAWHELNDFIFKELELDWANAVFLFNYNQNLPKQVSVATHPEIASQPIDTMHTWGDFVHAGERGFSRADAEAGIELFKKYNIQPRVWVDHSRFAGNMLHNSHWGSKGTHLDSSGNEYKVFEYSLDLVKELGIRYIWDGEITSHVGQDRELSVRNRLEIYNNLGKIWFFLLKLPRLLSSNAAKLKLENAQYRTHIFPDGNKLYVFKRFGNWRDADILGLAKVLSKKNIDKLIAKGGTMITYTHLGKTSPKYSGKTHIPPQTKDCLIYVNERIKAKKLLFTSLSFMLDYLVLRDNVSIKGNEIHFEPDGIRFKELTCQDLNGFTFSFQLKEKSNQIEVFVNNEKILIDIQSHGHDKISITF